MMTILLCIFIFFVLHVQCRWTSLKTVNYTLLALHQQYTYIFHLNFQQRHPLFEQFFVHLWMKSVRHTCIQGGPERMQHLRSIISRKRGTELKSCVHYCVSNSFPSKMTARSLILMKVFWFYGRFSEAMSFSRFDLLSQKSQFTYRIFSIVWLPRVKCLLLLCKVKPAWIKRSIHYIILQHYNPGELLKEIPPYLKRDFWYKRSKFWKWQCLRKMALESKCLHQNH